MSNDNFYKITNEKNGLLLDLQSGSTELGTNIITYPDVGSDAQRWGFISGDGGYLISSKASPSTAMDIDTGGQTGIAAWDCVGTANRLFQIQEVTDIYELSAGTPSNLGEAFYARIHNTEYDRYLGVQESDGDVFAYSQSEIAPELWKFTLNSDASYKITNAKTGKNLNLVDGNAAIGSAIATLEEDKTNAQKWYLVSKNGGYVLQCKAAVNNALDINVTDQTDITNQTETGEVNQVFQIEKYAKYTVNHYIQNWGDYASSTGENEYTLDDSYYAESISGASVTPLLKEYKGFITPSSKTIVPADDGSTVINYYYSFRFGDANDDTNIDANDLIVLVRRLIDNKAGGELAERQADINGDGKVSLEDFLRLKLYLADSNTPLGSVVGGVNLGNNFNARIGYPAGDNLNLSLLGDNVITYGSSSAAAQIWNFIRQSDGSYKIVNTKNGKCLNVDGGVAADGTNVSIADDNGSDAQRWYIYVLEEGYCLVPVCAEDFRLDVSGASTSPETNVHIWSTHGGAAQLFTIDKIVDESEDNNDTSNDEAGIEKLDLGDNFDAKINYPAANGLNLSLLGDNVITYNDSSAPAQVWNFIRQSNGSYKIVNSKNGKCLNVDGGAAADGTNVSIAADDGSNAQRWYICASGSNYCLVPACATSSRLDVKSGSTTAEARLQIWSANSNAAQVFKINKLGDEADNNTDASDNQSGASQTILGEGFHAKINPVVNTALNLSLSDTNVITYTASNAAAQLWSFVRQADGSYRIINTKNSYCLSVADGASGSGTNVQIETAKVGDSQKWNITKTDSGYYILTPLCATDCALTVANGSTASETNVQIDTYTAATSQMFNLNLSESLATESQMSVLRKIIYAVETGGQVYGNARYDDFTEAYTNSSSEHAITIGAGQWYAGEAKRLLNLIRSADPESFISLDTQGIATDLDTADWTTYKQSKTSEKAKCIQAIISTDIGKKCQDILLDQQMETYMKEAKALGVTDVDALMMCANIRHQGGYSALTRVLGKTSTPYTLDNIYAALQTDTGNQVGAYTSRQKMVYNSLKTYL